MGKSKHRIVIQPEDGSIEPSSPHPAYRSSLLRSPQKELIKIQSGPLETSGPTLTGHESLVTDLTTQHAAAPLGQRIIVTGQILDDRQRPIPDALVEIWQANASGRYAHQGDQWEAPLDPNFTGAGMTLTDQEGRYRFVTILPGAYPWGNHENAWRPAHIHFSVLGPVIGTRLVTQMYFPGDPLVELDPIACAIPHPSRQRMIARLDLDATEPDWALGYTFDIVLRGWGATPMESER